ncbi:MAG TPA: STAS domain-containing protein [Mycobacterium sp.]|uniref:STAS domain-containing protein n=1 Tax=Mycobacterium sp. TaxID=1785 RepID=UPI002B6138DE|nr:STAS domain-containing protein [Mycobacterium sp.]HME77166.1 STAS domain-containing protein [Mycobacterium sp.]
MRQPLEPWEDHTARFTAEWGASSVVITAHGELDASNAAQLADYVQRCAGRSESVIVNLSGLEFFGTAGFSALHTINVRCAVTDVRWAVVPSKAVSRLLRICDPDNALPLVESVPDSLDEIEEPHRLFQLVPQPR